MKNGKYAGLDIFPSEALKADVDTSVELLYPLFSRIWEEEEIPTEWKGGIPHQAPLEKRPQFLLKLTRANAGVHPRKVI